MTSQHLLSLADRVEGLSGPDREVDALIAAAARTGLPAGCAWAFKFPNWECAPDKSGAVRIIGNVNGNGDYIAGHFVSPVFTASIDAAMSLVPEGMRDEIEITTLYLVARVTINMNHGPDGSPFYGSNDSNSIPLALCAASLRAIAGGEG